MRPRPCFHVAGGGAHINFKYKKNDKCKYQRSTRNGNKRSLGPKYIMSIKMLWKKNFVKADNNWTKDYTEVKDAQYEYEPAPYFHRK